MNIKKYSNNCDITAAGIAEWILCIEDIGEECDNVL